MPLLFDFGELINELVDVHEATADADLDIVRFVNLEINSTLSKLVHALSFAQEQYFHFLLLRILVQVLRQNHIRPVTFPANINLMVFHFDIADLGQQFADLLVCLHPTFLEFIRSGLLLLALGGQLLAHFAYLLLKV